MFQQGDMPDYVFMIRTLLHMISDTLFASRKRQIFRENQSLRLWLPCAVCVQGRLESMDRRPSGQRHASRTSRSDGVTFCPRKFHLFDFLDSIRSQYPTQRTL
jgi:hypothetical protein